MTEEKKKIRLSKSVVGAGEKEALSRVIDNAYLGMGSNVLEFEEALKGFFGAKHVVCVNSGTAALHLALMGAGIKPGDEVLVQSLTYVASFQAISAAGAVPVPCEVIPETCTIDLKDAEKKLSARTRAIVPVHYASRVGDLDGVYEFASRHDLRVVEDAAHAFGTVYKGRKVGSFGDITCFSFDGIKNITSGEGGAILTSDDKVAQEAMDARLLGVQKDTEKRYAGTRSWEFDVTGQGYRYHMSNLFAAIGLVQLERFKNEFMSRRQELAKRYHEALKGVKELILFPDEYSEIVPHIFPVRATGGRREGLRASLLENNIECGVHYYPNHFLSYYGGGKTGLPTTEQIYKELLSLPLHPELTDSDQQRVIDCILKWAG